jgi:hypothetical protein
MFISVQDMDKRTTTRLAQLEMAMGPDPQIPIGNSSACSVIFNPYGLEGIDTD